MPDKRALLIGIENYPTKQLQGPGNDVADWASLVAGEPYNFAVEKPLMDSAATKAEIVARITTFISGGKPDDELLLYFSGHGTRHSDSTGTYEGIVGYPAAGGTPKLSDVLFDSEFEELITRLKLRETSRKLTIVMDCCHGGGMSLFLNRDNRARIDRARFIAVDASGETPAIPPMSTPDRTKEPHWLTAATAKDPAYEELVGSKVRGLFSYGFANAVRSALKASPGNKITHARAMAEAQRFIAPRRPDQNTYEDGPRRAGTFLG